MILNSIIMKNKHIIFALPLILFLACQPAEKHDQKHSEDKTEESTEDLNLTAGELTDNMYAFGDLPYPADALEPYIDRKIMILHYDKHHKGYFKKFLKAIEETDARGQTIENIFANVSNYSSDIRNNAGGYYNHWLFWESLSPDSGEIPDKLLTAIEKDFGSFEAFQDKFNQSAKSQFGSGWAWLILTPDKHLSVVHTPNQDNPLMDISSERGIPLMGIDVWEHAYYLQYENRRAEYIENFWNIINWDAVNERYIMALEGHVYNP